LMVRNEPLRKSAKKKPGARKLWGRGRGEGIPLKRPETRSSLPENKNEDERGSGEGEKIITGFAYSSARTGKKWEGAQLRAEH